MNGPQHVCAITLAAPSPGRSHCHHRDPRCARTLMFTVPRPMLVVIRATWFTFSHSIPARWTAPADWIGIDEIPDCLQACKHHRRPPLSHQALRGGIVFQSYSVDETAAHISRVTGRQFVAVEGYHAAPHRSLSLALFSRNPRKSVSLTHASAVSKTAAHQSETDNMDHIGHMPNAYLCALDQLGSGDRTASRLASLIDHYERATGRSLPRARADAA